MLAAGAFKLDAWRFLGTLAVVRVIRFGAESALAAKYWCPATVVFSRRSIGQPAAGRGVPHCGQRGLASLAMVWLQEAQ